MISNPVPQHHSCKAEPAIDWSNLLLGCVLAASPWIALSDSYAAMLNAFVCGLIIACAAGAALAKPSTRAQQINAGFGAWLMIAPWILGFSDSAVDTWFSLLIGLGVTGLASFQLSQMSRSRRG